MLEIKQLDNIDENDFNIIRKRSKKKQIIIYDTQRSFKNFVLKLKHRNNGKYNEIPHFIVKKCGTVYQLYDTKYSSNMFNDEKIDKKQIKIAVENLGWLNKNTIGNFYHNWIGETYAGNPHFKEWRGYHYWDNYTEEQMKSLKLLIHQLCEEHKIDENVIGTHNFVDGVIKFNGIVFKSNYSDIYNNINPSFNINFLS